MLGEIGVDILEGFTYGIKMLLNQRQTITMHQPNLLFRFLFKVSIRLFFHFKYFCGTSKIRFKFFLKFVCLNF